MTYIIRLLGSLLLVRPVKWDNPDPFTLVGEGPYAWQHDPPYPPYLGPYVPHGPNFFPLDEMALVLGKEGGVTGGHGSTPPREITGCCFPDGSCVDMDWVDCEAAGGTPMGQPCGGTAPCCLPDGSCIVADVVC